MRVLRRVEYRDIRWLDMDLNSVGRKQDRQRRSGGVMGKKERRKLKQSLTNGKICLRCEDADFEG